MRSLNKDYEYGHDLKELLDASKSFIDLSPEAKKNIIYLDDFRNSLRYKNMTLDPTLEEARIAIVRTKQIMQEFRKDSNVSEYMKEAEEVHAKVLKLNFSEEI